MKNTIFAILLMAVAAATVQAQDISVWDGSTEAPVQEESPAQAEEPVRYDGVAVPEIHIPKRT